jgi:hypothetical protein
MPLNASNRRRHEQDRDFHGPERGPAPRPHPPQERPTLLARADEVIE